MPQNDSLGLYFRMVLILPDQTFLETIIFIVICPYAYKITHGIHSKLMLSIESGKLQKDNIHTCVSLYIHTYILNCRKPTTNPQTKRRVFKPKRFQPSTLRKLVLTYQVILFKGTFPRTGVSLKGRAQSPRV